MMLTLSAVQVNPWNADPEYSEAVWLITTGTQQAAPLNGGWNESRFAEGGCSGKRTITLKFQASLNLCLERS